MESQYPTLSEAKTLATKTFAEEPACVEIEYAVRLGDSGGTMRVWIGRDGEAFDHSRSN